MKTFFDRFAAMHDDERICRADAGKVLGITQPSVTAKIAEGVIPAIRIGSTVRVRVGDLRAILSGASR